jgi:hypothetical protein
MTTKLPLPLEVPEGSDRSSFMVRSGPTGGRGPQDGDLEGSRKPGLWTGSREGIITTVIAFGGALLFGGAAGVWFAPGESGWPGQALAMALGSLAMAFVVSLSGSLLAGRNAIFWGMGMPLLVYITGTVFALLSGHAGAGLFILGAPVFMGLTIAAGVMTAYAVDRGD